jgi:hypothetical protein
MPPPLLLLLLLSLKRPEGPRGRERKEGAEKEPERKNEHEIEKK